MNLALPFTVSERFAMTLDGLCKAVAARIAGGAMQAAMIVLVWTRIRRIEGRLQGLLARFQAGRLRVAPGEARLAVARADRSSVRGGSGRKALPRRFGWLIPLVPYEAACFAGQLRAILAEPEMVALLAASAQARRVLRPLCRMLAIEPEVLTAGVAAGACEALSGEATVEAAPAWDGQVVESDRASLPDFRTGREGAPAQVPPLRDTG